MAAKPERGRGDGGGSGVGRGVRGGDERGGGKAGDGEGGEVVKARGAVANVATVRLKRLQHKQRRKVDRSGGARNANG